jgi:hypothetical protein
MIQYTSRGRLTAISRDLNTYKVAAALEDDSEI